MQREGLKRVSAQGAENSFWQRRSLLLPSSGARGQENKQEEEKQKMETTYCDYPTSYYKSPRYHTHRINGVTSSGPEYSSTRPNLHMHRLDVKVTRWLDLAPNELNHSHEIREKGERE